MEESEYSSVTSCLLEKEMAPEPSLMRLVGTSLEDSDARRGQSALVTGVDYSPSSARHFTSYNMPPVTAKHADKVHSTVQINPTVSVGESLSKGPTQKIESDMHSYPVCSIQDELPTRMIDTESSDDNETIPLLGPSILEAKKRRYCTVRCTKVPIILSVLIGIGVIVSLTLSSVLIGTSLQPGSLSDQVYIKNQDMVLVGYIDTYFYDKVQVFKALDNQCLDCKVEVYTLYPSRLIVADNYFNETSGILTATADGVLLAPNYYISSGSTIRMFVQFHPTSGQNSSVEFLVFNDLHQYDAFRRGDKPTPFETYLAQVNQNKNYFSLLLKIAETGYYFVGIRPVDTPVTFQSTFIIHQVFYSRANFPPPVCVFDSVTDYCTVQLPPSSTDDYTDTLKMCVLVYSAPPQAVATSYFVNLGYDVYRGFWTNWSKALFCFIGLSIVFICSLSFCFVSYCIKRALKS